MKKGIVKLLTVVLAIGLMLMSVSSAFAVLGPVHIELNVSGERLLGVRANQVTSFKIHIRINMDINVHDWIKIWFPIDEAWADRASPDPTKPGNIFEKICDSLTPINGVKESQRFIPNDKYFEKYTNKDEQDMGKLYEVLEDRNGQTRFDRCEPGNNPDLCTDSARVIRDPSGLGCWMLGTVLPPIPRDESKRKERLAQIIITTSIGITPCTACQGLPLLTNSCKERSYQVNSPMRVEPWRKGYNPIDFNISKGTGVIAPATPGRYRLVVATAGEPNPVESEAFVLPCSDSSPAIVTLNPPDTDTVSEANIKFNLGEGGALDAASSQVYLRFPPEFTIPASIKPRLITVNGSPLSNPPQINKKDNTISFISPVFVDNLGLVNIVISDKAGLKNPSKNSNYEISIKTSSEPESINSLPFKVGTQPIVVVLPNFEKYPALYRAVGLLPDKETVKKDAEITINFAKGTEIPKSIDPKNITLNGSVYTGKVVSATESITLYAPMDIVGAVKVTFAIGVGIKNPQPGNYKLTFTVNMKTLDFGPYDIVKTRNTITKIETTEEKGCLTSGYKIWYIPSFTGELNPGDTITIDFPEGTILPISISNDKITVGGKPVTGVVVNQTKLKVSVDTEIKAIVGAEIVVSIEAGIINTNMPGAYKLAISSDNDEPTESPEYIILMPDLVSEARFIDPDKPQCNEWYNTPPVLSIKSCNPFVKILLWYGPEKEKQAEYSSESRLSSGSMRTTIHYYAQQGDQKEEPKELKLFLDTIPPAMKVLQPPSNAPVITNNPVYKFKVERQPIEMLTEGDSDKYQVTDSIFVNGIQLCEGEIFETAKREEIKFEFESDIKLVEGSNKIKVHAQDQACNVVDEEYEIILDTKSPKIDVITPKPGDNIKPGEVIPIQIQTEDSASVYVNGDFASKLKDVEGGLAIFEYNFEIIKGVNEAKIDVTDIAGNNSTYKLIINGKEPSTVITLTLSKLDFEVNGEKMLLKVAPTSSTPPLPKDLAGNTFMTITEVAAALNVKVDWDGKEKKVTLTQPLQTGGTRKIELWIGKKQAKIDGKDVWIDSKHKLYPAIVTGKTMLPLRFVGEALGAKIDYENATKKITITYPAPPK